MNEFWDRVLFHINKQGMTQKFFCERSDIALATFNKWKAKSTFPKFEIVQKMAEVLNVDSEWLLTGEKGKDDPAVEIIYRHTEIRDLVMLLGDHPDQAPYLKAYLEGRIDAIKLEER